MSYKPKRKRTKSIVEYVDQRIIKTPYGCHLWDGPFEGTVPVTKMMHRKPQSQRLLKVLGQIHNVKIPIHITRTCGNDKCVNIDHITPLPVETYINNHMKIDSNGCWVWQLSHTENQCPIGNLNGKRILPRTVLYRNKYGAHPDSLRSICNNVACINPEHFIDTKTAVGRQRLFEAKVHINSATGCWEWSGGTNNIGYGMFTKQSGGMMTAHRAAWEIYKGDIPKGKHVLHTCDNRCCVNPEHLWLGTHTENMQDMHSKGRRKKGGVYALPKEQVQLVKRLRDSGASLSEVYEQTGVCLNTIIAITRGEYNPKRPGPNKPTEKYLKAVELLKQGVRQRDVAAEAGMSEGYVSYIAKKAGLRK